MVYLLFGSKSVAFLTQQAAMSEEKPEPQIFAIMRNGHEVIRGGMLDMKEAIDNDDIQTAKEVWQKLHKWTEMHKRMEEGKEPEPEGCGCFQ